MHPLVHGKTNTLFKYVLYIINCNPTAITEEKSNLSAQKN